MESRSLDVLFTMILGTLLAACSGLPFLAPPPATRVPLISPTAAPPSPSLPLVPSPAITTVPTLPPPTTAPTAAPAVASTPRSAANLGDYVDDRSTAQTLMTSYVNALNRKEYARAYAYLEPNPTARGFPAFPKFQQGYSNTASIQLTTGTVGANAGAGQLYWTAPVLMVAQTTMGATQTFVGCYTLHLSQPAVQGTPPFRPLGIQRARLDAVPAGANTTDLLAHACEVAGTPQAAPATPAPTFAPGDIRVDRYLDDRSDPVAVLSSFYNAINRKEYLRAYSYWQSGSQLRPYAQFRQGYADTASVQLATGTVQSDVGAGQLYYKVPVTLVAQTTRGVTQTFVGCYTLHLGRPEIQTAPPFQPMGITAATIKQVANSADTAALMDQACR